MNNPNCFRQPTPVDINYNPNLTELDIAIFRAILSRCGNCGRLEQFTHASRHYEIELNRGQCIFKVANFAFQMKIGRKRCTKSIELVSKWYTPMHIKGMPFGLVITLLEYDELINMHNRNNNSGTIEGQQRDNRGTANKIIEINKTVLDLKEKEEKSFSKPNPYKVTGKKHQEEKNPPIVLPKLPEDMGDRDIELFMLQN